MKGVENISQWNTILVEDGDVPADYISWGTDLEV